MPENYYLSGFMEKDLSTKKTGEHPPLELGHPIPEYTKFAVYMANIPAFSPDSDFCVANIFPPYPALSEPIAMTEKVIKPTLMYRLSNQI